MEGCSFSNGCWAEADWCPSQNIRGRPSPDYCYVCFPEVEVCDAARATLLSLQTEADWVRAGEIVSIPPSRTQPGQVPDFLANMRDPQYFASLRPLRAQVLASPAAARRWWPSAWTSPTSEPGHPRPERNIEVIVGKVLEEALRSTQLPRCATGVLKQWRRVVRRAAARSRSKYSDESMNTNWYSSGCLSPNSMYWSIALRRVVNGSPPPGLGRAFPSLEPLPS